MKNLIILSLLAVMVTASCSKDKTDNPYFVKFMVNGTEKSFTGYTFGHFEPVTGFTELSLLGANSPTADDNWLGIYISNYPGMLPIGTGVYEDNSTDFTILATHGNNDLEYTAGQSESEDVIRYGIPNHQRLKVTITEITSTNIRGTFSGDYYEDGDVQFGTKLQITNGEFNVKVR